MGNAQAEEPSQLPHYHLSNLELPKGWTYNFETSGERFLPGEKSLCSTPDCNSLNLGLRARAAEAVGIAVWDSIRTLDDSTGGDGLDRLFVFLGIERTSRVSQAADLGHLPEEGTGMNAGGITWANKSGEERMANTSLMKFLLVYLISRDAYLQLLWS